MKTFNTLFLIVFAAVMYGQCGTNGLPNYSFNPTSPDVDSKQFAVEFVDIPPPTMGDLDYFVAATADGSVVGCGPVAANMTGTFGNSQIYFNCDGTVPEAITCTEAGCTSCQSFQVYYYDVSENLFYPITINNTSPVVREYAFVDANNDAIIDGFGATDVAAGNTKSSGNTSLGNSDFNSFFTVLPVVFSYFSGEQRNKNVSLAWGVESEHGNESFVVERSSDGANFVGIDEVAGRGDSNEPFDYSAIDQHPKAGTNYYRLRQNDFEGSYTYSSVVLVNFDGAGAGAGAMTVSPNPSNGFLSVRISEDWSAEILSGQLIEASGRLVKDWQQHPGTSINIDLAGVPAGIYQLMMTDGKNRQVQRVIVR